MASTFCPRPVEGLNAHDLAAGRVERTEDLDFKFTLKIAGVYCLKPCSTGAALREDVFTLVTKMGRQDPSSVLYHWSKMQQLRFFCLPHCWFTCCCAVSQDRLVLARAKRIQTQLLTYKFAITRDSKNTGTKQREEVEEASSKVSPANSGQASES